MNTAFLDAVNLAWKLHHVESGFACRSTLSTYESERKLIAENLLDFDAKYAALFSQRKPSDSDMSAAASQPSKDSSGGSNSFIETFKSSCEFTSGYGVAYDSNVFNWSSSHPAQSPLFLTYPRGTSLRVGRIMPPANVTRVSDANVVHLEQEVPMNGSFRIYLFAGTLHSTCRAISDFSSNLTRRGSFYSTYQRIDPKGDNYHERHNPHSPFFTICTTIAARRPEIEIRQHLPKVLARYSDHVYADDVWDQRVPDAKAAAHAKMGLDEEMGGVVIVRPDGYVGCVLSLVEGSGTVDALNEYFGSFVVRPVGRGSGNLQAQL